MLKLRHFTRRLDAQDPAPRSTAPCRRDPVSTPHRAPDGERTLLPSAHGRINHVFMVATCRLPGFEQGMLERLLRLAGQFQRISLAVHAADQAFFRALAEDLGLSAVVDVIAAPPGAALWPWAQDRVTAFRNADGSTTVLRSDDPNDHTAEAAGRACGVTGSVVLDLPQPGGNILVDGAVCFVGADLGERAIDTGRSIEVIACHPLERRGPTRFQITPGDFTWRQDIDRCIAAEGSRQPVFHIDMFMTLAGPAPDGTQRILLGDPVWASELIGLPLPEGFPVKAFEQIEFGLRLRGYDVVRNPLPFVYFDNAEAKLREWFYASANNCWVECMGGTPGGEAGGCRVFLPEYGFGPWGALKATDDANAAVWEGLGFEVVRGGDFLPLADQLGSLNCVTRILDRA
jgi:hypothetical protein